MKNVFDKTVVNDLIARIDRLKPDTQALWGKMDVGQMLAHCNVTYELIYDNKQPKATGLKKLLLKLFVKNSVVNDKPYKRNSPTAPAFVVKGNKDFEREKQRLISYIKRTCELGAAHFDGKVSHSFGPLPKEEWNNMMYKHVDHHLSQFGV